MDKKQTRLRRARRTRAKIRELNVYRLSVHRTPRHMYAQITSADGSQTMVTASTLEKDVQAELKYTGNVNSAVAVGKALAKKAVAKGIEQVAFDRSGFKYHGRVKAFAESARENGVKF